MWGPCMSSLNNINPSIDLYNGTTRRYHSLTFENKLMCTNDEDNKKHTINTHMHVIYTLYHFLSQSIFILNLTS